MKLNAVDLVFEDMVENHPDIRLNCLTGYTQALRKLCKCPRLYDRFRPETEISSAEIFDMYPLDAEAAVCDRDKLLVKSDPDKAAAIKASVYNKNP